VRCSAGERVEILADGGQVRVVSTHLGESAQVYAAAVTTPRRIGATIGAGAMTVRLDDADVVTVDIRHMCATSAGGFVGLMLGPIAYGQAEFTEYTYVPPLAGPTD